MITEIILELKIFDIKKQAQFCITQARIIQEMLSNACNKLGQYRV